MRSMVAVVAGSQSRQCERESETGDFFHEALPRVGARGKVKFTCDKFFQTAFRGQIFVFISHRALAVCRIFWGGAGGAWHQ
jgi:hypothetical protein